MRYFSDFHNNGHVSIDGQGLEHFDIEDAKDEAINTLVDIVPSCLGPGTKETWPFASAMKAAKRS